MPESGANNIAFSVNYNDPRSISEGIMLGNSLGDMDLLREIERALKEQGLLKHDKEGNPYFEDEAYGLTSFQFGNTPETKYSGDQIMHQIQTILDQTEGGINPTSFDAMSVLTGKFPK